MTWHLKDRNLEKKLIAIDPEFGEKLNQNCLIWDSNKDGDLFEFKHFTQPLRYNDKLLGNLIFTGDQLEKIYEYNPNDWNKYPDVTPPESEMMRVDCFNESGLLIHSCRGYWNGQCWMTWNGYKLDDAQTIRFRPWED